MVTLEVVSTSVFGLGLIISFCLGIAACMIAAKPTEKIIKEAKEDLKADVENIISKAESNTNKLIQTGQMTITDIKQHAQQIENEVRAFISVETKKL